LNILASKNAVIAQLKKWTGLGIIVTCSLLIGIISSIISWKSPRSAYVLLGSSIILIYVFNIIISILTHKNVISRFPAEQSKSSKRISIPLISQFFLLVPLGIVSLLNVQISYFHSLFLVDIFILLTRLSPILNGFIYGLTNRRICPYFTKYFGKSIQTSPTQTKQQPGPVGQVNQAFSNEVM
jgi:hypothetical protein